MNKIKRGLDGAAAIVFAVTIVLGVLAYLVTAVLLFPLGVVLGILPLLLIVVLGSTVAGLLSRGKLFDKS